MTEFATITPLLRPETPYALTNVLGNGGGYFSIQQRRMPSFGGYTSYAQYIGPPDMPTPREHGWYTAYRVRVRLKPAGIVALLRAEDERRTREWK